MTKTPQIAALPGMTPLGLSPQTDPISPWLTADERCRLIMCRDRGGNAYYAHLTNARAADRPNRYVLAISAGPDLRNVIGSIKVLDKRTARAKAILLGATPWNF